MAVANRGPELYGVDMAFVIIAPIAVLLRCYVRVFMVKAFGVDDWLMLLSMLSFICYCTFSLTGVHFGTGHHKSDLEPERWESAMKSWWFCYLFYAVTMISSKLSIGFFMLRITVRRIHIWILYCAMFVSVFAGTVFFFVCMFQCSPVSFFWRTYSQTGKCINGQVIVGLAYVYSTFSIISDFTFAILPGFVVWDLQLKRSTKIVLIPLLAMGCIASSAVVVRLPYLRRIDKPDFLWETLDIAIWSTVEQGLAITAASLGTLRPLLQIILQKLGITTTRSRSRPSNYMLSASGQGFSRRKGSKGTLDAWKLTDMSSTGKVEEDPNQGEKKSKRFDTSFFTPKSGLSTQVRSSNESQEELSPRMSQQPADNEITVTKSFHVS